jgi:hypothetical protein
MGDELDYVALAADAEAKAKSAEPLHVAALWRARNKSASVVTYITPIIPRSE